MGLSTYSSKELAEIMKKLVGRVREATEGIKHVVIIMSGKGGVGKSIIAASLAIVLNERGYRVSMLDADMHGPSIPWLMGVEDRNLYADNSGKIIPVDVNGIGIVSVELAMDKKELPTIWRGPLKTRAVLDLLGMVRWGSIDYLVVDLPPGTGDEPQTIARYLSHKDMGALLVLTPGRMVAHIVKKAKNFAKAVGVGIIGAVVNMAYFRCPNCGYVTKIFGDVGEVDVKVLTELPLSRVVSERADEGRLTDLFREGGSEEWVNKLRALGTSVTGWEGWSSRNAGSVGNS